VKAARAKISTTIARENYIYLNALVESGKASTMAEALDNIVAAHRRIERRRRLEQATADYFNGLPELALDEENAMATAAHEAVASVDFDREL
jgi:hypothetical protein